MAAAHDDLSRLIALEQAIDRAHISARDREAARHRGVAWSGFAPPPALVRPPQALDAEAREKLARLDAWRASDAGRLLAAIAESQRAAAAAHAAGEAARAALARNPREPTEGCMAAAEEMAARTLAACRAARRARRIVRRAAAQAGGG
ncbi:MAG: hypothetical protein ACK4YQ_08225 [Phenylobacterium sp.]|uniref:hypothetical protein n=1 Tax=Phenylobacterium sp. TaxID=1871053 RepID=UPI00391BFC05